MTKDFSALMLQQAYHEAGHAVAALAVGFDVEGISLHSEDGPATHVNPGPDVDLYFATARTRKAGLATVTMALAGPVAERRIVGVADTGDFDDLVLIRDLVRCSGWTTWAERQAVKGWRFGGPGPSRPWKERVWATFGRRPERIVDREWSKIDRLAKALLAKPQMDGETVKKVCGRKRWR